MTPLHQRQFTIAHGDHYSLVARAMPTVDRVLLPMGGSNAQGFSNKCAAAAVLNVLETCDRWLDEPLPTMDALYREARLLAGMEKWEFGSFIPYVAEVACRFLEGAAKWIALPVDADTLANWLAVERTGIAYGMTWTSGHGTSRWFHNNILFPTAETVAAGHAIAINGFEKARAFRHGPLWLRAKSIPVLALENTHRNTATRYYIQAAEVPVYGHTAIVFVPPSYD